MSNQPILRRIGDLNPGHNAQHKSARALLDLGATAADTCKTCPKPLWFTAFFDGTGNNFTVDGNWSKETETVKYSNVAKLAHFSHIKDDDIPRTRFRYIEGVGTPCAKVGDSGKGIDFAAGMAAAGKGEARIRWMLNQLDDFVTASMPFVSQINLAVFGFSRGATQARAFVRMLTEKLAYQQGDELVWVKAGLDSKQPKVVIYFVGLLDTVASVGFGGSTKETIAKYAVSAAVPAVGGFLHSIDQGGHAVWANDLRIPTYVKKCVHYVAAHEVREKFPCDSVREDQVMPANCEEIFYPGVHSDVGGGYTFRCQEDRSNELSRVPLNNLYIDAWLAGVPLKDPVEVMASASSLFEISKDLEHHWNVYMGQGGVVGIDGPPKHDRLEAQVIWHMNRYYQWRASRRRRLNDGRLQPAGVVDEYLAIADKEWSSDIVSVAESRSGWIRYNVHNHQLAMYDAFTGQWMQKLKPEIRQTFDHFFDHYVHDSIAGFKNQMMDGYLGFAEDSRWSVNRRMFMGKRGKSFLYWSYEGGATEYSKETKVAHIERSTAPREEDSFA
jgi:Uncharacterized alpha/beta hydrolase domain (DUF2235)